MKRMSVIVCAFGALALGLSGCGQDESPEVNGLRKVTQSSSSEAHTTAPTTTTFTVVEPPADAPTTPALAKQTTANGAQTTCGEFRDLTDDTQKQVIDQVLTANPGSELEGSPNVALGTAKLACLAQTYTDTPVAVAIRVAAK
ncbi:hypothetical protein HLB23_37955 [Nocardia uniformis]|uniref:Uncharacterized protein n=1 Tax=Nocardia uniformis TaxID=53432 RepID=A0A849CAK9_9NOCA|nr:hypothetical protein [Nocardia uniformis]NNH75572.1 hypothetical protein [Nocardia uniformis]